MLLIGNFMWVNNIFAQRQNILLFEGARVALLFASSLVIIELEVMWMNRAIDIIFKVMWDTIMMTIKQNFTAAGKIDNLISDSQGNDNGGMWRVQLSIIFLEVFQTISKLVWDSHSRCDKENK